MTDKTNKPVIFLAFANDRDDTVGYLRNLPDEVRRLRDVLTAAEQAGLCEVEVRSNSTAADIFKVFQNPKFRNRVAIFHYGGHANGYQLLLESAEGQTAAADAGGLAAFLAQQQGLQLVFLNGCSTQQQTQGLLDANVPAVISTSRSIDDKVATDFSCQFYQGLACGATIRTAYNEAAAAARTAKGGDTRALHFGSAKGPKIALEADRWPWNLYLRKGSERADQWNLPEAVNDPLFGLPPLPEQDLPETPYRQLNWFTRKHAEVFFGRGHQIRELYDRLTAPRSAPIILFYGQSGVGKSSVLDAGLIPRLERDHEVRYLRRTAGGLLNTLQLAFLPEASGEPVESAWRAKERQTGKPLIVVLDQVEEHFTRPIADMPDEMDQLLNVLQATFGDPNRRPQGKLVLGFRKEWLAELESHLVSYELPRTKVFLERLDRRGIIEVVLGPARSERLRERYGLTVEEGLAGIIADDLLEDHGSAIAPTLQILLTKMWNKASDASYEHPHFGPGLYQHLKRDGILLRDFLNQQIAAFREQYPEAVDSGLLLDIVALHTTPLGTADQCTVEQLNQQYAHLGAKLPDLLQKCQSLYLLTIPTGDQVESSKTTRLAHDTLAPLIRESFDQSDKPGQRARRILDNRSVDWEGGREGTPLDEADLAVVEKGVSGTRALNTTELRLLKASCELRRKLKRARKILSVVGVLAVAVICLAATGLMNLNGRLKTLTESQRQELYAARTQMAYQALQNGANQEALLLLDVNSDESEGQSKTIYRGWEWSFLRNSCSTAMVSLPDHHISATCLAYSSSLLATGGSEGVVCIWKLSSRELLQIIDGDSISIRALAWWGERQYLAVLKDDGGVAVWDVEKRVSVCQLSADHSIRCIDFSSKGILATADVSGSVAIWRLDESGDGKLAPVRIATKETGAEVACLSFHGDDKWLAVGRSDTVLEILGVANDGSVSVVCELSGHEGPVTCVHFMIQSSNLISGSTDGTVRIWDVGQRKQLFALAGHNSEITSVDVYYDNLRALSSDSDGVIRIWDLKDKKQVEALSPHEAGVTGAVVGNDGRYVASAHANGRVFVWGVPKDHLSETYEIEHGTYKLAFGPDQHRVAILTPNGDLKVFDLESRKETISRPAIVSAWADGLSWNDRGLCLADRNGRVILVDHTTGKSYQQFSLNEIDDAAAIACKYQGLAFSGDGTLLAARCVSTSNAAAHDIIVIDVSDERILYRFSGHSEWVIAAAFSTAGDLLATCGSDKSVCVWDLAGKRNRYVLTGHDAPVLNVAFTPDGRFLASSSWDKNIVLWDMATGKKKSTLSGHTGGVAGLAFTNKGDRLASSGTDATVRIWDWDKECLLLTLSEHSEYVSRVAFSNDDKFLGSSSPENKLRVWGMRSEISR